MREIISRQQAIAANLPRYFTGKACKHGHLVERFTANKTCVRCANDISNASKAKDMPRWTAAAAAWGKKNPEKVLVSARKYREKNPGATKLRPRNTLERKRGRMPPWLNAGHLAEMEAVYEYCAALRACGLDYHVDHIVPSQGKNVSGLHVPWNLQVITREENLRKGNRHG